LPANENRTKPGKTALLNGTAARIRILQRLSYVLRELNGGGR
jgi:hypothetical protein